MPEHSIGQLTCQCSTIILKKGAGRDARRALRPPASCTDPSLANRFQAMAEGFMSKAANAEYGNESEFQFGRTSTRRPPHLPQTIPPLKYGILVSAG